MRHQLRVICIVAVSLLTSVGLVYGQSVIFSGREFTRNMPPSFEQSLGAVSAFSGQANAGAYTFASAPKQQEESSQPQGSGNQAQSQAGNQNQGTNGNQNGNPNQNKQGQGNKATPPEKPHYLTYTPKKKSLQEEAKSGKARPVEFKSVPAGAQVTVDGYFLGKTPMTTQIPFGKHLVSISKWGYQSWEHEVNVTAGSSPSVNPTLHKDW